MRTVALIQARMGSSRLPGKSLMALAGRPLLAHVIERVQATPGVDEAIVATTSAAHDDPILAVAALQKARCWRGSEWDVYERMRAAAEWAQADICLRVTADCPLFAPDVAHLVLQRYAEIAKSASTPYLYCWNDTATSGYPDGLDVEVFSRPLLEAARNCLEKFDREHVTPGVRRLAWRVDTIRAPFDLSRLKISVDTQEDFERVARIYEHLRPLRMGEKQVSALAWQATLKAALAAGVVDAV